MVEKVVDIQDGEFRLLPTSSRARRRTPFQREQHLLITSELYLRQWTQARIAERLGVSKQQINYDLKEIQERWRAAMVANVDEIRSRELARIDELEREYWETWELSKAPTEATTSESSESSEEPGQMAQVTDDDGLTRIVPRPRNMRSSHVSIHRETRRSLAALAGIERCIAQRRAILGLDKPLRIDFRRMLRDMAIREGLDPEEIIREAEEILDEAKS